MQQYCYTKFTEGYGKVKTTEKCKNNGHGVSN